MKSSPKVIGFIQSAGLALYVSLFATIIQEIQNWIPPNAAHPSPGMGIVLFLLAFVISALICGSLILGYPILLFSAGKHREAMKIVLWSLLWLVIIAIFIACADLFLLLSLG